MTVNRVSSLVSYCDFSAEIIMSTFSDHSGRIRVDWTEHAEQM